MKSSFFSVHWLITATLDWIMLVLPGAKAGSRIQAKVGIQQPKNWTFGRFVQFERFWVKLSGFQENERSKFNFCTPYFEQKGGFRLRRETKSCLGPRSHHAHRGKLWGLTSLLVSWHVGPSPQTRHVLKKEWFSSRPDDLCRIFVRLSRARSHPQRYPMIEKSRAHIRDLRK